MTKRAKLEQNSCGKEDRVSEEEAYVSEEQDRTDIVHGAIVNAIEQVNLDARNTRTHARGYTDTYTRRRNCKSF